MNGAAGSRGVCEACRNAHEELRMLDGSRLSGLSAVTQIENAICWLSVTAHQTHPITAWKLISNVNDKHGGHIHTHTHKGIIHPPDKACSKVADWETIWHFIKSNAMLNWKEKTFFEQTYIWTWALKANVNNKTPSVSLRLRSLMNHRR